MPPTTTLQSLIRIISLKGAHHFYLIVPPLAILAHTPAHSVHAMHISGHISTPLIWRFPILLLYSLSLAFSHCHTVFLVQCLPEILSSICPAQFTTLPYLSSYSSCYVPLTFVQHSQSSFPLEMIRHAVSQHHFQPHVEQTALRDVQQTPNQPAR